MSPFVKHLGCAFAATKFYQCWMCLHSKHHVPGTYTWYADGYILIYHFDMICIVQGTMLVDLHSIHARLTYSGLMFLVVPFFSSVSCWWNFFAPMTWEFCK